MIKDKTCPLYHAFDEYEACKGLFERKRNELVNNKFGSFINACITNNATIEILKSVSKYMMYGDIYKNEEDKKKYSSPSSVRKLLWKWIVVNIYLFIKPKTLSHMCEYLEPFKNGINIYDLIDLDFNDDSLYSKLLNDPEFKDKDVKLYLTGIYSKYCKNVESLVKLNYSFFCFEPRLEYYVDGRHNSKLDLVICDVMNEKDFFKFDFEVLDIEQFKENLFEDKLTDTDIRSAITFIGLLTDKTLKDHKVYRGIKLNRNKINIFTLNKGFSLISAFKFIDGEVLNDSRTIRYEKIVPFRVIHNGITYMIDKKGINKTN